MDDAKLRRVLKGHWLVDMEPTPLITARARARLRIRWINLVLFAPFLFVGLAWWHTLVESAPSRLTRVATVVVTCVALGVALCVVSWIEQRADLMVLRSVAQPTIGASTLSPLVVLGRLRLATAVLLYLAGVVAAVIRIATAESAEDVAVAAAFVVCVVVLAGLAAGLVVDLLRRPAVALDGPSQLFDDQVRWTDAKLRLAPPGLLGLAAAAVSTTDTVLLNIFLVYALGSQLVWSTVEIIARGASPVSLAWESAQRTQMPPAGTLAPR